MSSLAALRADLAAVVSPPPAVADSIPTGHEQLDRILPGGGIPCGRLTEVSGAPGSGRTSLARALVASALAEGRRVAVIDGDRTLDPSDWASLAGTGRLWMVRPPEGESDQATWCADVLLRSGSFGLVVLDTSRRLTRATGVRLTRMARESSAALVILRDAGQPALTGGALRLRLERLSPGSRPVITAGRRRWHALGARLARAGSGEFPGAALPRRYQGDSPMQYVSTSSVTIDKGSGGRPQIMEVQHVADLPSRLRQDPEVPDRRAVAKRNRRGEPAAPDAPGVRRPQSRSGNTTPTADSRNSVSATSPTLPRKRRFAEPDARRDGFLLGPAALGRNPDRARHRPEGLGGDGSRGTGRDPRRDVRERSPIAKRGAPGAAVER